MNKHPIAGETRHLDAPARSKKLIIRPGRPEDAPVAADLIYLPMGTLGDHLFGANDFPEDAANPLQAPYRTREILATLFARENNRFSYQFADFAEVKGEITGMLLGYSGRDLTRLGLPTARQLLAIYGWAGMTRFLAKSRPFMGLKEAMKDEFFILTLAVLPECQSNGLGAHLLHHAEEKARAAGLTKCSLGVTVDNDGAIRFYKRYGFEIDETCLLPELETKIGYKGYYRMVRDLAP